MALSSHPPSVSPFTGASTIYDQMVKQLWGAEWIEISKCGSSGFFSNLNLSPYS